MDAAEEEEEMTVPHTNRRIDVNRSKPTFDKENQGELAHYCTSEQVVLTQACSLSTNSCA